MNSVADTNGRQAIKVGFVHNGYPERRNFANSSIEGVIYQRKYDFFRFPEHLIFRLTNHTPTFLHNVHSFSFGVDLLHFFNGISIGSTPWITTFETALPRWNAGSGLEDLGLRLLAGDTCRRLIAMSECTVNIQRAKLRKLGHTGERIAEKLIVLHSPQRVLCDTRFEKSASESEPIRFMIVGADFFIKGGLETLEVFDSLLSRGENVHLTIVSTMQWGDYATRTTRLDAERASALISKWPDRITHFTKLPNADVLDLMRKSHVGLLPSWADTYGYSVLEAQAAGCPVVTTDIRALPEINDERRGWIVSVPKDAKGFGVFETSAERSDFRRALVSGLQEVLSKIIRNRNCISSKSEAALAGIRAHHDPESHASLLADLYAQSL